MIHLRYGHFFNLFLSYPLINLLTLSLHFVANYDLFSLSVTCAFSKWLIHFKSKD